jgi:hypothetical protein
MTDAMIILLCLGCYMAGGISSMATLLVVRQAKTTDRRERLERAKLRPTVNA